MTINVKYIYLSMDDLTHYIYCIPTAWFRKNIYKDCNQILLFENKGLRVITRIEENTASIETLFISTVMIHDLSCPLSIENIPDDMKDILQCSLFECMYIKLTPDLNKISIYSDLSSHAFKYNKNIIISRDNPYNLDFNLNIVHESYISIDKLLECSIYISSVHSISIHTSVSNNNFFMSGYDEENNKSWVYIQEKSKWTPGEGATRVYAGYLYYILEIIKKKIKFSNVLKIKISDSGVLILVLLLNDGTHIKSIIAPMIQIGGLVVDNDDLPTTN